MGKEKRRRNAAVTREAILASALQRFARAGYDSVGVREIAKGAGVTAMMVNRYFGSKEQLFAEVARRAATPPRVLTPELFASDGAADRLAAALVEVTKAGATPLDGFVILLQSATSEPAAAIGRQLIESHHFKIVAGALDGEWAAERSGLLLSLIAGLQVMRQMIGLSALAKAQPERLAKLLAPVLRELIEPARQRSRRPPSLPSRAR